MRTKRTLLSECDRVNALLKEDALKLGLGTKNSLARMEACKGDLKAFSELALLEFREYVRRCLLESGSVNAQVLIYGGARMLKLNPETTKRYLRTLRSRGGPFSGLGDVVIINPNYVAVEEDAYWVEEGSRNPTPEPLPKRVRLERGAGERGEVGHE